MKNINKSELFTKAHKLAKRMTGDYIARFALALRILYKQFKNTVKPSVNHLKRFILKAKMNIVSFLLWKQ